MAHNLGDAAFGTGSQAMMQDDPRMELPLPSDSEPADTVAGGPVTPGKPPSPSLLGAQRNKKRLLEKDAATAATVTSPHAPQTPGHANAAAIDWICRKLNIMEKRLEALQAGSEDTTRHCREAICKYDACRYGDSKQTWLYRRLRPEKEKYCRAPEQASGPAAAEQAWQQLMLQVYCRILRDYAQTRAYLTKKALEEPAVAEHLRADRARYVMECEGWCQELQRGLETMQTDRGLVARGRRLQPEQLKTVVAREQTAAAEEYLQEVDEALQELEGFGTGAQDGLQAIRKYYPSL